MSAPKFKAGDVVQVLREIDTRTITARGDFNYLYHSTNAADNEWLIDADWLDHHGTLVEPVTVVDVLHVTLHYGRIYSYHAGNTDRHGIPFATVTSYSDGTVRYEELPKDGAL